MSKGEGVGTEQEFKGLRSIVWPIHNFELKKFLPMGLMMLCILFIYTLVRDLKDTLMVSCATGGGAETLGFLKLYGVTPSAIVFMIVFVKLANIFEREKLFVVITSFFLAFFALFGFILYPLRDILHLSQETITSLQETIPRLHWVWPVIGNWSYALFYILSELWGSVVLTALFWQFANEIMKVTEAKRFYSLFGFIGNFGLLASGSVIIICANFAKGSTGIDAFGINLRYQMGAVVLFGSILLYLLHWMYKHVLTDPKLYNPGEGQKKKSKPKLGLKESAKMIFTSPYLLMIAVLLLAYGVSINLIECVWKGQIKMQYPDSNDYNALMGKLSFTTGCITIIVMLVGANILRRFSWRTAALVTPMFLLLTSVVFFGVIMYENANGLESNIMGVSVLLVAVITGLVQNAFSKGVKYSLFDSTMQMAYIPLDQEQKVKGQAAVGILAGRGGKSGGAFIQSTLLLVAGGGVSLSSMVDILGSIVFIVVILWIISVFGLSKKFEALTAEKKAE
ncbi:MAG: NTP/NDP exchange transporter [Holosporales bacterium]|nr:NTP/NDP exchange transporter [Holosporales bacterium]